MPAAVGDLEIRTGALNRCPEHPFFVSADSIGFWQVVAGGSHTDMQFTHQVHDVHPAAGTNETIDALHLFRDQAAVTFGQTSRGDQKLTILFGIRQFAQHIQ